MLSPTIDVRGLIAAHFGRERSERSMEDSRDEIDRFRRKVPGLPGVLSLFHVSGANDYLLHVSAASPDALREFVLDHLTADPAVVHAETSLIFEHVRGAGG